MIQKLLERAGTQWHNGTSPVFIPCVVLEMGLRVDKEQPLHLDKA